MVSALGKTDDFAIRHEEEVNSGKVRSVYWLSQEDSDRLIAERDHNVAEGSRLGVMIISDRISAFDCNWRGEGGLDGVAGKGASLNAISKHWFNVFDRNGLARNHVLESPHPLVWIVQRADPIMVEAIARQHITGSMWRGYDRGEREICGIALPDGLEKDQRLDKLLITPSTKGIMTGIPGVPEKDDVNITRRQIVDNYEAFGFRSPGDVAQYERLLRKGFSLIDKRLRSIGQIFVDTKFEFGYAPNADGGERMIYIDEVGTPDSSRMWDGARYNRGEVAENSKEFFRKWLLENTDRKLMLDKNRMGERKAFAAEYRVPANVFGGVSEIYTGMAKNITGESVSVSENPREEIMDAMSGLGLAA